MGTAPILSNDGGSSIFDLDTVLGFTMPDTVTKYDKTHTGSIIISTTDAFSAYTTFVTANGNPVAFPASYYYDADGDTPDTTPVTGSVKATWYNGATKITNLADKPSACEGPYTLKIETTNVVVKSKYGNPINNNYSTVPKTYNFIVDDYKICNLKPNEMTVYSHLTSADSAFPYQSGTNKGGYNPAKWDYNSITDTHKGFKATSGFPTTGFAWAKFQMVMSGYQSLYTFSSSDSTNVSIDSSGNVTLLGKPSGPVTLTATLKSDPSKQFPYTFTLSKWAKPLTGSYPYGNTNSLATSTVFPAASMCRNGSLGGVTSQAAAATYFFSRAELTNSPLKTQAPGGAATGTDRFSRDTDSFLGEWGNVYNGYANSGWGSSPYYWTRDACSANNPFGVTAYYGEVAGCNSNGIPSYSYGTVCRG